MSTTRIIEIKCDDDQIDVRDVTDRIEQLEVELADAHDDDEVDEVLDLRAESKLLTELLDDLRGNGGDHQWRGDWYPVSLIRDSYFVEAMEEMVKDIGDMPANVPNYIAIDWDQTAENLRVDYTSCEFDGVTYWYR